MKGTTWRMAKKCSDCPFASRGAGLHLRCSLNPGRWTEILAGLKKDGHFLCHQTTRSTGNGSELLCAGAIQWQEKHGLSSQMVRIMERLDIWYKPAKTTKVRHA